MNPLDPKFELSLYLVAGLVAITMLFMFITALMESGGL